MADTDYEQVLKSFQEQRKRRTDRRSPLHSWVYGIQPGGMGMQHGRGAAEWGLGIAERYDDPTMPAKVLGTAMPAGIFDLAGMAQQGGEMLITGETGNLPGRISGDPLRRAVGYDPEDPQALMGEIAGPDVLTAGIKGLVAAGKLGHSMLASAPWLATKLKQLNKGGFFSDTALLNAVKEASGNSRTAIVEMTPNQFLAMAEKSKRNEAKMEGIQEVLNRGEGMESTPFMYVDMREADDGSLIADVTGHEGRHRARTLIDQGLGDEPMPVRIISREGGDVGAIRWSNDPRRPTEMLAEGGRESDRMPFPRVLGDQAAGYAGPAFRYEPGFEGGAPPGSTVGDVLAEEMSRKGVDDLEGFGIDPATYESIKDLPADAVTWVGRNANRMMQEYGPTDDWAGLLSSPDELSDVTDQVAGGRILYEDESGVLILRPDAPPSKGTLSAQFLGKDDNFWDIGEDAYGQMEFRKSGHSPVSCTGYACEIQEKLGKERVTVMGFDGGDNPASAISEIADGHDFAVVDGRYIVDPWVTDVEDIGKGAYDMTDPADAAEIRRLYGDPNAWETVGQDAPALPVPDDVMSMLQSNIDALGPARASQFTIADLNRAQQIYDPAHAAAEPQSRRMVDIAKDLQEEALQAWGGSPMEFTPENASIVADNMTKEAIESLKHRPDMAGWYKGNLSEAMGHASSIYPELATDPHAETAFKLIMAVTSNGKEVEENAKITNRLYQEYRKTGQFPIFGSGKEKGAMEGAFRLANKLVDEWGFDDFTTFLNKQFTVRELKQAGFNVSGELMDTTLNGSVIFGPKVGGGFFQNLTGNYNPATFDLWWTRTFGRHTATALHPEAKIAKQRAALREAIGRKRKFIEDLGFDPKAIKTDDEQLDELARVLNGKFAAGGHKDKNPINNASRNLMTSVGKTREAPSGGGERNFMRDVISQVQKNLSSAGIDLDIADIQALLWYTEQDLYLKMGGKVDTTKKDYATVWKEIAEAYLAGQ